MEYSGSTKIRLWFFKIIQQGLMINLLAPERWERNFTNVVFILQIVILSTSCENGPRWTTQNLTDEKSTLVRVVAWCRQATSHHMNHCWPRSPTPYAVTMPQWVNCQSRLPYLIYRRFPLLSCRFCLLTCFVIVPVGFPEWVFHFSYSFLQLQMKTCVI